MTARFQPAHHWTDQKMVVHAFFCIFGLSLLKLVQLKPEQEGTSLNLENIKDELASVQIGLWETPCREGINLFSDKSKLQAKMLDILSVEKVAFMLRSLKKVSRRLISWMIMLAACCRSGI